MGYMTVESHSHTHVHLKRLPGLRSWALLVALLCWFYVADSWMWKLFYVSGCCFVAIQNLEEWECDAVSSLLCCAVVAELNHLRDVSVVEERVHYLGKGYLVVLRFATGFSHPLTQSATLGGRSSLLCCAVVAELNHLRDVSVVEDRVRYLGKGYLVVLRFATGFSHPLTQSATLGGRRY
ncbi:CYBC1 protein, partial [Polyodon spathula]|nr:CYBC1 protein [Polyodon spathula]